MPEFTFRFFRLNWKLKRSDWLSSRCSQLNPRRDGEGEKQGDRLNARTVIPPGLGCPKAVGRKTQSWKILRLLAYKTTNRIAIHLTRSEQDNWNMNSNTGLLMLTQTCFTCSKATQISIWQPFWDVRKWLIEIIVQIWCHLAAFVTACL